MWKYTFPVTKYNAGYYMYINCARNGLFHIKLNINVKHGLLLLFKLEELSRGNLKTIDAVVAVMWRLWLWGRRRWLAVTAWHSELCEGGDGWIKSEAGRGHELNSERLTDLWRSENPTGRETFRDDIMVRGRQKSFHALRQEEEDCCLCELPSHF